MPAGDFAPGTAAAVSDAKTYLIKGGTLKKLLQRVECDPSQFDVKETPEKRIYRLRKLGDNEGSAGTGGDFDLAFYTCDGIINPPTFDFAINFRGGLATLSASEPTGDFTIKTRVDQISCFDAGGP